jgi:hypothetical protein
MALIRVSLCCAVLIVSSINSAMGQLDFGFFIGPTYSSMSGSFPQSADGTLGIQVGTFLEQRLHRHWSAEIGVNMVQKGAFNVDIPGATDRVDYRLTYAEFPVLLHLLFPVAGKPLTFGVYTGAAAAMNIDCDVKPSDVFEFESDCLDDTAGGRRRLFEFAIPFGADFRLTFEGGSRLGFDLRYSLGLRTALMGAAAADRTARNNVWTVFFRLALPLIGAPSQ